MKKIAVVERLILWSTENFLPIFPDVTIYTKRERESHGSAQQCSKRNITCNAIIIVV